ncbi:MAG: efflux RND transporter periplasmic adaptor subunit [Nitrospina sp.]|jgi:cobalt-zinc-cadmium efflux system membrane fusion protein|nr:efflux RND transporter periplasmic adaptor subunit [Nitrospina sp.]MBT3416092.1 efflux RND transporter periplasmic adaptor subunit [Nitrospina sp.]MBT3857525.1 efflux RND transporter periplasmic adaptor subunit [Nitrospina sp.]MBT4105348.1 efflux RND transporter periplasmic adaptor subunit [Nitrospina sp.]MBT4388537.1 efflux RND transporter periplasmic adaptor subunit [Nitrospina sp.]
MKKFILLPLILILGVFAGKMILNMDMATVNRDSHEPAAASGEAGAIPRGSHGGWLFSKDDLEVEVKIFETGIPPEFRVYVTDASGKAVPLNEVDLSINLKRLDRVDEIHFKPAGGYLLGDKEVVEPHSFDVKIRARWKEQTYEWEFAQIEARVELPDEAIKNADITIQTAGPAKLKNLINLSGEIGLNEEKVVHIVPRLNGVVKKVFKDLGDRVRVGDVLAIIESRELADAKINYLAATKQVNLAKLDLERQTLISKNTAQMLDLLQKDLDLEEVYRQLKDLQIGRSRELLISAYAKLSLAKSVYLREKKLLEKGISSESEYLLAVENYKSGEAKYIALREKIAYDSQWAVRQKKRTDEMETLKLQTARQKLFALGLTDGEVGMLPSQKERMFTQYELRSPLGGVVIQKHLTTGEAVKNDDDIFLLADFSDVWVNIAIPAKDLKYVKLGQNVVVKDDNLGMEAKGKLTYLDSIIDETSRTVTGRVVIPNAKGHWRPGTFVTLRLVFEERKVPIAVPEKAIQTIRDWSVVFVKYGNFFEARPLELGKNDGDRVEVLAGLKAGEQYVVQNSFVVKAEIEKSSAVHSH